MKIRLKITGKLITIIVVAIVLSVVFKEYLRLGKITKDYEENLKDRALAQTHGIIGLVSDMADLGFSLGELRGLDQECRKLVEKMPMAMYCLVMDKDRVIQYHNNPVQVGSVRVDSVIQKALNSQVTIIQKFKDSSGVEVYDISTPIIDNLGRILGVVSLGVNAKFVDDKLAIRILDILNVNLVSTLIAILLVYFLAHYSIINPINILMKGVERVSQGDFGHSVPVVTRDEIGQLAQSFNKMSQDLGEARLKERKKSDELTALAYELSQAKEELEDWSLKLEQKVEEKTKELKDAHKAALNIMEDLREAYEKLKNTQEQLIQSEKMSAMGILASGVAHEVKNPLGIIIQGINFLESSISEDSKDGLRVVKMIKESVTRADNIIRGLLDYARVSTLSLKPEDINAVLIDSLTWVKYRKEFSKVEVLDETKKDIRKVLIDKNKIQQIFINLLSNALNSMPEGGRLTLRTFEEKLEDVQAKVGRRALDYFILGERVVRVEIQDTGYGMSQEVLGKIFDPFFSTRGPREGAGLGLSICSNIINLHKGLIDVVSKEGQGTKITLTLKIAKDIL